MSNAEPERTIFLHALQLSHDERADFLAEACGSNIDLRERIERLIEASEREPDWLERGLRQSPADATPTEDEMTHTPPVPHDESTDAGDRRFPFLTPADDAGILGRLGRFEVLSVLGQGGMGIVFKARDPELDRIVAVKVLAEQKIAPDGLAVARRRFIREAKAMATLRSDYVIQIHEVQKEHTPAFFVMEYIHGRTLDEKIKSEGPLEIEDLLRIAIEVATGLRAAHQSPNKLIHRDIKPSNILLVNGIERVKIVDFGLAKGVSQNEVDLTGGMILGTAMYMSPEQARSDAVDARSDLFSLGITLYCMAAGEPPFRGRGLTSVLNKVINEPLPPLADARPELPAGVADLINRLTAKEPEDRVQSAAEVVRILERELTRYQEPQAISGFDQTVITETISPSVAGAAPDSADSASAPRIRRWYLWTALGVLLVGLLAIGAVYYFSRPPADERIDADELRVTMSASVLPR